MLTSVDKTLEDLQHAGYLCDETLATSVYLAHAMQKPLLLEGPAGVGKTQLAKTLAQILNAPLIRLQCYEGLDEAKALYEWNYGKQMLHIQMHQRDDAVHVFTREFLLTRPLLKALETPNCVLLIDEVDRSDPEFEALLLELLSEWQLSIPELGTLRTQTPPLTVLTSNASRDIGDALRRRCLYAWLDYPTPSREAALIAHHVPEASARLTADICELAQTLRGLELQKSPSISEILDWTRALVRLGAESLDPSLVTETLTTIAKYRDDIKLVEDALISKIKAK